MRAAAVSSAGVVGSDRQGRRRWWALACLIVGNLTVFSAATTMNVAIPRAQTVLGFSDSTRAAVVTLYSLCFGTFMLLGGRLSDVLGLRRCLCAGLIGFAIASTLGGLAPSVHLLLISRAGQGATGALVAASGLAMISVMFAGGAERTRAFGLYGMAMGMGTAASFTVAGALVDSLSWRWVMLINTPLALVVAAGVMGCAPALAAVRRVRLRLGSAVHVTIALGILVIGFDRAGVYGWNHGVVIILLTAAALLLAGFIVVLRRTRDPLIPLFLLGDRDRLIAFCAVFVIGIGVFAGMFILTNLLQDVLDHSPLLTGAAFLPWGLAAVAAATVLGPLGERVPVEVMLASGMLLVATAIGSLVRLTPDSSYLTGVLPAMLLLGAGSTAVMVTGTSTATWKAGDHSGIAGAMVNASQQIGAALGTALLTAIITSTTRSQLVHSSSQEATVTGYATASAVGAVVIGIGAISVFAVGWSGRRSARSGEGR